MDLVVDRLAPDHDRAALSCGVPSSRDCQAAWTLPRSSSGAHWPSRNRPPSLEDNQMRLYLPMQTLGAKFPENLEVAGS